MAGLELWWLGQAGFRLRDPAGGQTVFCDPFITPGDRRTWQAPVEPEALAQADLVLLPINGRDFFRETERNLVGNMDYREAARLASDIGVQLLIPMHWELFAHNRGYPDHLVGFTAHYFPQLSVLVMGRATMFTY